MITDKYRNLVNSLKARNGLPPLYPASVAAEPEPKYRDVGHNDADSDDDMTTEEALELLQEAVEAVNGDMDQPGDDDEAADDNNGAGRKRDDAGRFAKVDVMTQLGDLALPARRLMVAHYKALLAEDTGAEEKHAKAVSDAAAFVLASHRRAQGKAA